MNNSDFKLIHVEIADMKIAQGQNILRTILGSCVGICLYDAVTKIGGMAHIMLPSGQNTDFLKAKYADTAIPFLLQNMISSGAKKERIVAKIAGGAKMFALPAASKIAAIGDNNVKSVKDILSSMNIRLISEDTGGENSRTISFFLEDGRVKIKRIGTPEKII